jgi:hypothetical protein
VQDAIGDLGGQGDQGGGADRALQPRRHGAAGDAETAGSLQLVTFDHSIPLDAVHGARAANLTVL